MLPLVLYYGNIQALDTWHQQVMAAALFTKDYAKAAKAISFCLKGAMPLCTMLGRQTSSCEMLEYWGFDWSADGLARVDAYCKAYNAQTIGKVRDPRGAEAEILALKLLMCVSGCASYNQESDAWLPSPTAIAELERADWFSRQCGIGSITSLAARAFLTLGHEGNAVEMASIAVSAEQQTMHKHVHVDCRCLLGQVAAAHGKMEEAEGHYAEALKEAKASRLPVLEVLAAHDWYQHVLERTGRGSRASEEVIEQACTALGKTREQLSSIF